MRTESVVDLLIENKPYSLDKQKKEKIFKKALLEELCHHYNSNEIYRKFCTRKSFNPHTFTGEIDEIPYVAVSVFKEMGQELVSIPKDEIKISLQSSATSGRPSTVILDRITSKRQTKVMVKVLKEFIGENRKPFIVVDVSPKPENIHFLGARYAAISGYLNFASKVEYALHFNKSGTASFNIDLIKNYIKSIDSNEPIIVFGFTYILFSYVTKQINGQDLTIKLPKGSKIIHIGGWKKLESEKIGKDDFNNQLSTFFGIEENDVIDIYGFTEQMGLNYPDCKCGYKHAPIYSEVIVRDPVTHNVLPEGEEGVLEFISPIQHSYPGNLVLTDDLGVINKEPCSYGRSGTRFKILGRLKKAEIRGCGDILSNKLRFQEIKIVTQEKEDKLQVICWKNGIIDEGLSDKEKLKYIISELKTKHQWLKDQPIDLLVGLIGEVSKKWLTPSPSWDFLKEKGLIYLANWSKPEHLIRIANIGLRGKRHHIDSFQSFGESRKQFIKANSLGIVAHWLAGNVQVLGMFALIQSILTKNVNILKVSGNDDGVFSILLKSFEGVEFTSHSGHTIKGDDLLKTIAVIYFSHSNIELGELMSVESNARIAWGGREAVQSVSQYPANFNTEDIIFGPKLSFSVIANDLLQTEKDVKKLARKVAVDISIFDQTGCASPHNLFIERGGVISPKKFCLFLANSLERTMIQIPKGETSIEQISEIHSARGVYDFKGEVFASYDSSWTVLFSEDSFLNKPIYSRVITVHAVDSIDETLKFINEDTQTIGMAAKGEKALNFATNAVDKGIMRCPEIGRMLNFESPWDGIFIMERLVRWTTMGGPLI